MTNFEFLQKYQQMQNGVMYDEIKDFGFAQVGYCKGDDSSFWNLALVDKLLTPEELLKIEEYLTSLNRKPALYFEKRDELETLVDFLKDKKYQWDYSDSWLFYTGSPIETNRFNQVKKVETEEELEVFIKTFDDCYQENDPQNPYGKLGDYLEVAKNSWLKHHANNRLEYFVAYKENQPVAVGSLNNYSGIGYISNVGSLPEVRGGGFGKLVTLYMVEQSKKKGNTEHVLSTEEGHFPHEFYQRIGFKPRFVATGYVKNE
ncbi:MAG: GNAT family N-acetyltransferase [Microgenomates group bacterium]|jgi:ribosomal protein S18 acetylase RimI-like enzyme